MQAYKQMARVSVYSSFLVCLRVYFENICVVGTNDISSAVVYRCNRTFCALDG